MSSIEFERSEEQFQFMNPLNGFEPETQTVEVRRDPLLRHCAIHNPQIKHNERLFVGEVDRDLVDRMIQGSEPECFFCPDKIAGVARFPEEFVPEGVFHQGETVLFPNLFALGGYHGVAAISQAHFLELHEFTPGLIGDALIAVQDMVEEVFSRDPEATFVSVNTNYLFPAGARLVHPHFQALVTRTPYTHQSALFNASLAYFARTERVFAHDLIEAEQESGERYIGNLGGWHWLAAYAPMGSNEIQAYHEGEGDIAQLDEQEIRSLATGMSAALRYYESLGHLSFNFSIYAHRDPGDEDGFRVLIRMFTRQNPYHNYRSDDFFLQKGLQSELMLRLPEVLAGEARPFFFPPSEEETEEVAE